MSLNNRQTEIIAIAEKLVQDKASLLGADGYLVSEPYGKNRHIAIDRILRNTPLIDDAYGTDTPQYDDYPTEGGIGTRYVEVRLHSYLPSGISGPNSVQSFLTVSTAPVSNGVEDIDDVRLAPLINPEFSIGKANAAEPDLFRRGFSLALYPAMSGGGIGLPLVADTSNGPISPTANPGLDEGGFWTIDYEAGIVRFSTPPVNGPMGVMNPNNVFGSISGDEASSATGAITMFATFYNYTGAFGVPENSQFITVGDGYISEGIYTGNEHNTVQMAVDAMNALGGGTVFIKEGTYSFEGTVTIPGNVSIIGLNGANIIQFGSTAAFRISGSEVELKNLTLISNSSTTKLIQFYPTATNEVIENVIIEGIDIQTQFLAGAVTFRTDFAHTAFNNIFLNKLYCSHSGIFGVPHISAESGTFKSNFCNIHITDGYYKTNPSNNVPFIQFFSNRIESINNLHIHNNFALGDIAICEEDGSFTGLPVLEKSSITNNFVKNISVGYVRDSVFANNNATGYIYIPVKYNTYFSNNRSGLGPLEGVHTAATGQYWIAVGNHCEMYNSYSGTDWLSETPSLLSDPFPPGGLSKFYDVSYNKKDLFVQVGTDGVDGLIYTSPDGTIWTETTNHPFTGYPILAVDYDGKGLWVAVGGTSAAAGILATSTDGVRWTQRTTNFGTDAINDIAHNGKDLWVAVGDNSTLETSSDGITWTSRNSGISATDEILCVVYNSKLWMIGTSSDKIATSVDSITWTVINGNIFGGSGAVHSILNDGKNLWTAAGGDGTNATIATSPDGIVWTTRYTSVTTGTFYKVAYNGYDRWIAVGGDTLPAFVTSSDGINWTTVGTSFSDIVYSVMVLSNSNAGVIAHGSNDNGTGVQAFGHGNLGIGVEAFGGDGYGVGLRAVGGLSSGTGIVAVGGAGGGIGIETFGSDHASPGIVGTGGSDSGTGVVGIGGDPDGYGGAFYGTGSNAGALGVGGSRSGPGIMGIGGFSDGYGGVFYGTGFGAGAMGIGGSASGTGIIGRGGIGGEFTSTGVTYVAVGNNGKISTSYNGINWTSRSSGYSGAINTVAYNGRDLWLAGTADNTLLSSSDGITWTSRTIPGINSIRSISYDNNKKLWAMGGAPVNRILVSFDGVNWKPYALPFTPTLGLDGYIHTIKNNNRDQWLLTTTHNRILGSSDGINWTLQSSPFVRSGSDNSGIVAIAHNRRDMWIAGGTLQGTSNTNQIARSFDGGTTWMLDLAFTGSLPFGNGISSLAHNRRDLWVAGGFDGAIGISSTGTHWSGITSPVTTPITSIIYNGMDLWVGVTSGGEIITSSDGRTWTSRTSTFGSSGILSIAASYGSNAGIVARGSPSNGTGVRGIGIGTSGIGIEGFGGDGYEGIGVKAIGGYGGGTGLVSFGGYGGGIGIETYGDGYGIHINNGLGIKSSGKVGGKFEGKGITYVGIANIGVDTGKVIVSPDGSNWFQTKPFLNSPTGDLVYNGKDLWVLTGGGIFTSTDGWQWNQSPSVPGSPIGSFSAVGYNNKDLWVTMCNPNTILTSPDGYTWTRREFPYVGETFFPLDIEYNDKDLWAGVGLWSGLTVAKPLVYSNDGIHWYSSTTGLEAASLLSIGYDGKKAWVAHDSSLIYISYNGINWSLVPQHGLSGTFSAIAHNKKNLWMIVGTGIAATSQDGIHWLTKTAPFGSAATNDILYDGKNSWIAISSSITSIAVSKDDGTSWTYISVPVGLSNLNIGYGSNAGIIAHGSLYNGTGVQAFGHGNYGIGVEGFGGDGYGVGIKGVGGSAGGTGVVGFGGGKDGYGVLGVGSSDGYGGSIGVIGIGGSISGAGVLGIGAPSGYGLIAQGTRSSPSRSAFRITPQLAAPTIAQVGDLYVNATDGKLYICTSDGDSSPTAPTWTSVGSQ